MEGAGRGRLWSFLFIKISIADISHRRKKLATSSNIQTIDISLDGMVGMAVHAVQSGESATIHLARQLATDVAVG